MDVTDLLQQWQRGDQAAFDAIVILLYEELKKLSSRVLREVCGQAAEQSTMSTTALLHEAFPRLASFQFGETWKWEHRAQFYALAKKIMLWVLLDYEKYAQRHGGRFSQDGSPEDLAGRRLPHDALLDLETALDALHNIDLRSWRIISMRFLEDLSVSQIAEDLEIKKSTVYNEIKSGLGFLRHHFVGGQ